MPTGKRVVNANSERFFASPHYDRGHREKKGEMGNRWTTFEPDV